MCRLETVPSWTWCEMIVAHNQLAIIVVIVGVNEEDTG